MQLEHIEAIERRLWSAADTLRANSNYASNEYFLPVMGLVFLRQPIAAIWRSRRRPPPAGPRTAAGCAVRQAGCRAGRAYRARETAGADHLT